LPISVFVLFFVLALFYFFLLVFFDFSKIQPMNEANGLLYDERGGSKKALTGKKKGAFAEGLAHAKQDLLQPNFNRMGPVVPRKAIPDNCVGKRARITTSDGDRLDYLITGNNKTFLVTFLLLGQNKKQH
jgi:hypothetical protein